MNDLANPYYCPYIYKNIYIEKTPGNTIKTSACCVNDTSEKFSVVNFFSNKYLNQQRQEVKQNQRINSCNACWSQEDLGNFSLRNATNNLFKYSDPYEVELLGIDYNVSPICNAKCIMCSSYYSSAWAAEDAKFDIEVSRRFNEVSSSQARLELDYRRLQKIYFNGGEPLLSTEMADVLCLIKDQQGTLNNLDIRFNTNGSIFPSDEILSLLSQAKSLTIFFSIDAINEPFEYIRNPLKWADVQRNVIELSKASLLPNKEHVVGVACATGIHNALEVTDLVEWFHLHSSKLPHLKGFSVQPVNGHLSLSSGLSSDVKGAILNNLTGDHDAIGRVRKWVQNAPNTDNRLWMDRLAMIDLRRGSDWREVLSLGKVIKF